MEQEGEKLYYEAFKRSISR